MRPIRIAHGLAFAGAVLLVAACGSGQAPNDGSGAAAVNSTEASTTTPAAEAAVKTLPRPAVLAGLPTVELIAPGELDAGRAPDFEWAPVDGASSYRLSVLDAGGPTWAWHGAETTVRYGGVPNGTSGPSLRPGSWWSVSALGPNDALLALSELRAVSPERDAGPAPSWARTNADADAAPGASASPAATAAPEEDISSRPCNLLSTDEITDAIRGDWSVTKGGEFGLGFGWCDWTSANGTLFSVTIEPADNYNPTGWGADRALGGLGSKAYAVTHGWDRRIGFVHDDVSVTLVIDYTKVDPAGYEALARLVDDRLP